MVTFDQPLGPSSGSLCRRPGSATVHQTRRRILSGHQVADSTGTGWTAAAGGAREALRIRLPVPAAIAGGEAEELDRPAGRKADWVSSAGRGSGLAPRRYLRKPRRKASQTGQSIEVSSRCFSGRAYPLAASCEGSRARKTQA